MIIIIKNTPVEPYHSIGMIKYYHGPLRQGYSIIPTNIPGIEPNLVFQMSFKAINNLVGPNRLVSMLLIFGVYLRMTEQDALSLLITQHAIAMQKAMDEVQKYTTS